MYSNPQDCQMMLTCIPGRRVDFSILPISLKVKSGLRSMTDGRTPGAVIHFGFRGGDSNIRILCVIGLLGAFYSL